MIASRKPYLVHRSLGIASIVSLLAVSPFLSFACAGGENGAAKTDSNGDSANKDPSNDNAGDSEKPDQTGDDADDDPTDDTKPSDSGDDDEDDDPGDDDESTDPGDDNTTGIPKWDLGGLPDSDIPDDGDVEFSFIWIANSVQGTVSKIDTRTRKEVARYYTGPDGGRDPSRTSVNLDADVAVVNRDGGLTKIMARSNLCTDRNGDGRVTTSTGPNDLLEWGQDDCVVWNRPLPVGSRPAAWTLGTEVVDPATGKKTFKDPKLWVSGPDSSSFGRVTVFLLNGDTGMTEKMTTINDIAASQYGLYGAAVDSMNDFWAIPLAEPLGTTGKGSKLVHVSHDNPANVELIDIPKNQGYGMTVDRHDNIWVGCDSAGASGGGILQRYDPKAKTWTAVDLSSISGSSRFWIRGMMVDENDELWAAVVAQPLETGPGGGLLRVDTVAATLVDYIGPDKLTNPPVKQPTGASIDIDGQVWLVDQKANVTGGAFVLLDRDNYMFDFVGGLNGPYTYSDMTGFALQGVKPQG